MLEEQFHQFHIYRAAGTGLCGKARSAFVSGSNSSGDQERCKAHGIDVGISTLVKERSYDLCIARHRGTQQRSASGIQQRIDEASAISSPARTMKVELRTGIDIGGEQALNDIH